MSTDSERVFDGITEISDETIEELKDINIHGFAKSKDNVTSLCWPSIISYTPS